MGITQPGGVIVQPTLPGGEVARLETYVKCCHEYRGSLRQVPLIVNVGRGSRVDCVSSECRKSLPFFRYLYVNCSDRLCDSESTSEKLSGWQNDLLVALLDTLFLITSHILI